MDHKTYAQSELYRQSLSSSVNPESFRKLPKKKRMRFHVVPEREWSVNGLDARSALRSYLGMDVWAEELLSCDGIESAVTEYVTEVLSGIRSDEYGPAEHVLMKDLERRMGDSFPNGLEETYAKTIMKIVGANSWAKH